MVLKWLKHVPFVFEVRDQWPEVPIELGIVKNKVFVKLLLWLEKTIYKQSSAVVALSPGMADGVRSALNTEKPIAVIPNSCDTEVFRPDIDGSAIRKEHGWDDKLVLLYFGTMGKANGLQFVVDAAERLKNNGDIRFVLVGDGSEKTAIVKRIEHLGLDNIEILGSIPKGRLPEFVAACDISVVIFANYPILEHNSANKFFDSLSAGKPVLLNYSGWQREILEENKAGFGCELCNIEQFVENILYLSTNRDMLATTGKNARLVAERKFSRDKLAAQTLSVLEATVKC
jgi:glycosyltransferase involved in cell wall biosynthesis